MRVLIVCPWANRSGHYWPCGLALANALSRKAVTVDIIAPGRLLKDDQMEQGIRLFNLPIFTRLRRFLSRVTSSEKVLLQWDMLAATLAAAWHLSGNRYDCMHFINAQNIPFCLLTLTFSRQSSINNTYGFPESASDLSRRTGLSAWMIQVREWLIRCATSTGRMAVVCETPKVLEALRPIFGQHVYEIPYSISPPVSLLSKDVARRKLGLPQDRFIFLLFGTHRREKDYVTVMKALGEVPQRALALFSGALISDNDPRDLAKSLPADRTAFIDGFVPDDVMALSFNACDFVIVPYEEGFARGSGVLLEACRYRRPIIATDTGHLRDFVQANHVGLLYTSRDAEDLAVKMAQAMSKGYTEEFRDALESTAVQFSWDASISQYLELYRRYSNPVDGS
jgi:glycosyltransferase involved in cell wall biosynthesis